MIVNGQIVSITNRFIRYDEETYQIFLFSEELTLPFCDLLPIYQQNVEFIGLRFRTSKDYDIDIYSEIYYEIDTNYVQNKKISEYLLYYNESELIRYHRQNLGEKNKCIYPMNTDNVLRIIDGIMNLGLSFSFPWGNHDPRIKQNN
jgi:hypothetical protein